MSPPRLFIDQPLAADASIAPDPAQAHYLLNVLRMREGDAVLVFNGRDGEWRTTIAEAKKKSCVLRAEAQSRPQENGPDIDYLFAPIKRSRLDYMAQKATEMGVASLRPVITTRTNAERVNLDRLRANAIEAAEQCGVLRVPEVRPPMALRAALEAIGEDRRLIFCDEAAPIAPPLDALAGTGDAKLAVLIGPEGGFAPDERQMLLARPRVTSISLGPRVMRADTAAVAALALVNAALADWRPR